MAGQAAIDDPAILLDFRRSLIACLGRAQRALEGMQAGIQRTEVWLQQERGPAANRRLRQTENRLGEAKVAWLEATTRIGTELPRAHESEERDYRQARAVHAAAEETLQQVRRWQLRLPRESAEALAIIHRTLGELQRLGPQAITRLDRLIAELDAYHRTASDRSENGPADAAGGPDDG